MNVDRSASSSVPTMYQEDPRTEAPWGDCSLEKLDPMPSAQLVDVHAGFPVIEEGL